MKSELLSYASGGFLSGMVYFGVLAPLFFAVNLPNCVTWYFGVFCI